MGLPVTCFRWKGVTTEFLPPVTRLGIKGFARNVFSLKRSYYGVTPTRDTIFVERGYYGVTPTRDTSWNQRVCLQRVFVETELLRRYSHP